VVAPPVRERVPREAFPPVRLPPLSVRYVNDAPAPVVVPETKRLVVEAVPVVVEFVVVMPVPVAVILPAVSVPMFAAGPEEEPVREPVTFPVRFPVTLPVMPLETMRFEVDAVPVTTRLVVVAVFETMRLVVEALEVAMREPMVPTPMEAALALMLFVNVWSWFHEFAVVVPKARERLFDEKRMG
jgi:hypothetical protein